jgi:hypothetical protein
VTTVAVKTKEQFKITGGVMDAKWNNVVDNVAVRIGMVVVGFSVWLAVSYGLLSA